MFGLKLVPYWKTAWRWLSMQAMTFNVAFLATWAILPDDLKSALPSWLVPFVAVAVLLIGIAGRMVHQEPPAGAKP